MQYTLNLLVWTNMINKTNIITFEFWSNLNMVQIIFYLNSSLFLKEEHENDWKIECRSVLK